jgi:hypothetical protein
MKCLFDINEVPNKVYDWNKRYAQEEEIQLEIRIKGNPR